MNKPNSSGFKKAVLSASITAALSVGVVQNTQADIYEFSFANGGCYVDGTNVTCTGPGDGIFTMLDPGATQLQNTSYPYYGDPTWGYGLRTQMGGKISYDTASSSGSVSINPFDFFNGGAAAASGIVFKTVDTNGDGTGTPLWLANMLFAWNNNSITTQVVWNPAGLLNEINVTGLAVGDVIDSTTCSNSGECVLPATDGIKRGKYPIGAAPIATSTFNVTGQKGTSTLLSDLDLGTDDGTGGAPMDNGPFSNYSANFDFSKLTVSGYNDTTPPVIALASTSINVDAGDTTFDINNPPGYTACTDNSADTLTTTVTSSPAFDINTPGEYVITYTCTDQAGSRDPVQDPADSGGLTTPADNSFSIDLTVTVVAAGTPTITMNGGDETLEACTLYEDAGATGDDGSGNAVDPTVVDNDNIIGTAPNEMVATIDYTLTGAPTQTRTVTVVDTQGPVISIDGGDTLAVQSTDEGTFTIPAATATDANNDCNPVVDDLATTSDTVDFTVPDGSDTVVSILRYTASDTANTPNETQANLTVTVVRAEPVITLIGNESIILKVGETYTEQGMDIRDVQDGVLTGITASGSATGTQITEDIPTAGTGALQYSIEIKDANGAVVNSIDTSVNNSSYTVTYTVTDSDGNTTVKTRAVSVGVYAEGSNFSMMDASGKVFGGTNDVVFDWDETALSSETDTRSNVNMYSAKPEKFNGYVWTAHDARVFGPGTYSFDTACTTEQVQNTGCPAGTAGGDSISMTVGENQLGMHVLFDWNTTANIDVVVVWDKDAVWADADGISNATNNLWDGAAGDAPDPEGTWKLVSRDVNGDGINGTPMVDGPFKGFYANFNIGPSGTGERRVVTTQTVDTALGEDGIGSMGLGLLASLASLLGFAGLRRRK